MDLRLASKPMSVHRRIPSDEALMRMAAYHRAPVPIPMLPTVTSPPNSPNPSQDLTSIVDAMHEGATILPCLYWSHQQWMDWCERSQYDLRAWTDHRSVALHAVKAVLVS